MNGLLEFWGGVEVDWHGEVGKLRGWKQLVSPRVANYIEFYLPKWRLALLFTDHNQYPVECEMSHLWDNAFYLSNFGDTFVWAWPHSTLLMLTWTTIYPFNGSVIILCYDMSLMPSIILITHGSLWGITQAIEMKKWIYCVLRLHKEHDKWSAKLRGKWCQKWAWMGLIREKCVFKKIWINRVWESNYLQWGLGLCQGNHNCLQRNIDEYRVKEAWTWA